MNNMSQKGQQMKIALESLRIFRIKYKGKNILKNNMDYVTVRDN